MPLTDFPGTHMTLGGVECVELFEGSGTGTLSSETGEGQRAFIIEWANLATFAAALLGDRVFVNETVTLYTPPLKHSDFDNWYCKEIRFDHLGRASVSGTRSSWEYAKINATFGPFAYNPEDGENNVEDSVEESLDFGVDAMMIPPQSLYDGSQGLILKGVTKVLPLAIYRIRGNGLVTIPGGTGDMRGIFSRLGKINSTAFKGAEVGKARFDGAMLRRSAASFDTINRARWDVELAFAIRAIEWNKVWSDKLQAFDFTYSPTGALVPIYESTNLNDLLPR